MSALSDHSAVNGAFGPAQAESGPCTMSTKFKPESGLIISMIVGL
ncbi:hypothetical protein GGE45_002535 [Rhizobium aethiopicum]|uniref:Uncharacterized protein n=1 Tax=Rhizobium aethiopicum TaxID=1138170 RepID=A0A7W6MC91_9HYPH|nr:hypothetical protein [Rhizobium aethiopicum]MBB4580205.1 hypothetical protein [Rhizobium aethiopicum]